MKNINIVIIDDYLNLEYINSLRYEVQVFDDLLCERDKTIISHGTRVMATIEKYNKCDKKYIFYSIYNGSGNCSEYIVNVLTRLIEYKIDVLVMSFTIKNRRVHNKIQQLCEELKKNGTIIIAAAANDEEFSFPAIIGSVIGVGRSFCCGSKMIWNGYEGIQILANVLPEFVNVNGKWQLFSGTSKANAIVVARILNLIDEEKVEFNNWLDVLRKDCENVVMKPTKSNKCLNVMLHRNLIKFLKEKSYEISEEDEDVFFGNIANNIEEFCEIVQESARFLGIEEILGVMNYFEFNSSYSIINYFEDRVWYAK